VGLLKSKKPVNLETDYKYMVKLYDLYYKEFKYFKVDRFKVGAYPAFAGLLLFLQKMKSNFSSTFANTVDNTPGMRLYLITHVTFDIHDGYAIDWLIEFMIDYLIPTEDDMEEFREACIIPKVVDDIAKEFNAVHINPLEDDVIIRVGMWNRGENDRLLTPFEMVDTALMEDILPDQRIVREILDDISVVVI